MCSVELLCSDVMLCWCVVLLLGCVVHVVRFVNVVLLLCCVVLCCVIVGGACVDLVS